MIFGRKAQPNAHPAFHFFAAWRQAIDLIMFSARAALELKVLPAMSVSLL